MNVKPTIIAFVSFLLTAALLAGGCHTAQRSSSTSSARLGSASPAEDPGVHVYTGFDTSESIRPHLGSFVRYGAALGRQLDPGKDLLTLYRVDRETLEFWDDPPPSSGERLQKALVKRLEPRPARNRTLPARFWQEVAGRAADDRGSVGIVFYSDGGNDDQSDQSFKTICKAAQALAANPYVLTVEVFGVNPRCRPYLRRAFAPLGPRRFHLHGLDEMNVQPFIDRLNAARSVQP
jgi:hypothetical protein